LPERPPTVRVFLGAPQAPARGLQGGVPVDLIGGRVTMSRRRIYEPRIVTDHIMMQDDFDRLHEYLLERESIPEASDDLRKVVEDEWPELAHKLPPKD
jgi:hypothetical protein